jgi:hypothetical protein
MLNETLKSLWASVSAQATAGGHSPYPALPSNHYPFIQYNPDDGKFIIIGDTQYFSDSIGGSSDYKCELWFNSRLFELMSSFQAINAGPVGDKNYRILFLNNYGTNEQQI